MRQENLKMQIALRFPFGHPDKNGVIYSKESVEQAISSLQGKLPILYRDNDVYHNGTVIGHTAGDTASVLWDDEHRVCEVVLDAVIYYGGTECVVNNIRDGVITDFEITALCESCIHKKVCRFEVPIGEKCNDYIKEEWFGGEASI